MGPRRGAGDAAAADRTGAGGAGRKVMHALLHRNDRSRERLERRHDERAADGDADQREDEASGGHGLGSVLSRRHLQAQDFPRHVRTQFFAQHHSAARTGFALDDRATLGGNLPIAAQPFADGRLLYPEGGGHGGLAPEALDGAFDGCHASQYRHYRCQPQAHCLLQAVPVAICCMETPPMHTGKQLGDAIREAMTLKGVKQQAVADAFGVKQSSVSEWLSFGRLHKKHLTRLLDYFSDVVGPDHWGLPKSWGEHPLSDEVLPLSADEIDMIAAYRLLDAEDKAEFYAHLGQVVMSKHGPTLRIMERMKLTTRADDASVKRALGNVPKSRPGAELHLDRPKPKPAKAGKRAIHK